MAELDRVAVRQIDYRELVSKMEEPKAGGLTLDEETTHGATNRYSVDAIVNICISLEEVGYDSDNKEEIVRDSIGILDHLDTLGMEVRFKR